MIGELELGWRLVPNEFIAVTGTNGKTTTVELIGAMHRAAGLPVAVAGNVGTPVSALAGSVDPAATVVCEVSSFQLEDCTAFAPEVAVLLNLSPVTSTGTGTLATTGTRSCASSPTRSRRTWRSWPPDIDIPPLPVRTVRFVTMRKKIRPGGRGENRDRAPRGRGAGAATWNAASPPSSRSAVLARCDFRGLAHRFETVGEIGGVTYINDSKATNPSAAAAAISSFDAGVHAILGGSLKGGSFADLPTGPHSPAAYLIGEAADSICRGAGRDRGGVGTHAATSSTRSPRRPSGPGRARSCCSLRRARASTSTATTSSAASTSARSWRSCDEAAAAVPRRANGSR